MAVNKLNLRHCQILYGKTTYDIMIAVSDLCEVDSILQDWALDKLNVTLDLPSALVMNEDVTDVITNLEIDEYVYIESPVSAYMRFPRFAGVSGVFPTLPTVLVDGYYVIPTCLAFLWSLPAQQGYFGEYIVPESQNFTLSAGMNYFGISFNSGSPMYQIYTSWASMDFSTVIPVAKVLYFGGSIYNIPWPQEGDGAAEKIIKSLNRKKAFEILDPYTLALDNLSVQLGAINVQHGVDEIACSAVDTSLTGNDMYLYYLNSSLAWLMTKVAQISNSQYQDPSTGIQTLTPGKFVANYLYRAVVGTQLLMFYVLSDEFDTAQDAMNAAAPTNLPPNISGAAVCVGRVILAQGTTTGVIQMVAKTQFGS